MDATTIPNEPLKSIHVIPDENAFEKRRMNDWNADNGQISDASYADDEFELPPKETIGGGRHSFIATSVNRGAGYYVALNSLDDRNTENNDINENEAEDYAIEDLFSIGDEKVSQIDEKDGIDEDLEDLFANNDDYTGTLEGQPLEDNSLEDLFSNSDEKISMFDDNSRGDEDKALEDMFDNSNNGNGKVEDSKLESNVVESLFNSDIESARVVSDNENEYETLQDLFNNSNENSGSLDDDDSENKALEDLLDDDHEKVGAAKDNDRDDEALEGLFDDDDAKVSLYQNIERGDGALESLFDGDDEKVSVDKENVSDEKALEDLFGDSNKGSGWLDGNVDSKNRDSDDVFDDNDDAENVRKDQKSEPKALEGLFDNSNQSSGIVNGEKIMSREDFDTEKNEEKSVLNNGKGSNESEKQKIESPLFSSSESGISTEQTSRDDTDKGSPAISVEERNILNDGSANEDKKILDKHAFKIPKEMDSSILIQNDSEKKNFLEHSMSNQQLRLINERNNRISFTTEDIQTAKSPEEEVDAFVSINSAMGKNLVLNERDKKDGKNSTQVESQQFSLKAASQRAGNKVSKGQGQKTQKGSLSQRRRVQQRKNRFKQKVGKADRDDVDRVEEEDSISSKMLSDFEDIIDNEKPLIEKTVSRRPASASPRASSRARSINSKKRAKKSGPLNRNTDTPNSKSATELAITRRRYSPKGSPNSSLGSPYRAPIPGSESLTASNVNTGGQKRKSRRKKRQKQENPRKKQQKSDKHQHHGLNSKEADEAFAEHDTIVRVEGEIKKKRLKTRMAKKHHRKVKQLKQQELGSSHFNDENRGKKRNKDDMEIKQFRGAHNKSAGTNEQEMSTPLISPQMAAPDLVLLRPSNIDYSKYVPIRSQKDEAPAQGALPARPRKPHKPRRPASAGGRMKGVIRHRGRRLKNGRQARTNGTSLKSMAQYPQWKIKLLVDAEMRRRKKRDNIRLRFERDIAMEELARAKASIKRMKSRLSTAAKTVQEYAQRAYVQTPMGGNTNLQVKQEPEDVNQDIPFDLSLEEILQHSSSLSAAKQFVGATATTLFHGVSLKKLLKVEKHDPGNKENSSPYDQYSNGHRRKRFQHRSRRRKEYCTLVSCSEFIAVLGAAKEEGAILPHSDELQAVCQRLSNHVLPEKNGNNVTFIDLEEWALYYPGDAAEVLRWSCTIAQKHIPVRVPKQKV